MRKRAFNSLPDERVAIVIVESCEPVGESSRKKFDKNFENSLRATVRGTSLKLHLDTDDLLPRYM